MMDHAKFSQTPVPGSRAGLRPLRLSVGFWVILLLPVLLGGCFKGGSAQTQVQSQAAQTLPVTQPVVTGAAAEKTVGMVSVANANLRKEPSEEGEILDQVKAGSLLVVLKPNHTGIWHQVEFQNQIAFIRADLMELAPEPGRTKTVQSVTKPAEVSDQAMGMVNTGTANIREQAAESAPILGLVYGGEKLKVTKLFYAQQWHQVEFSGGVGYIHADLLTLDEGTGQ